MRIRTSGLAGRWRNSSHTACSGSSATTLAPWRARRMAVSAPSAARTVSAGRLHPTSAGVGFGMAVAAPRVPGRAAGTMAAGAGAVVRQGYGAVRTAAYKLAALRGRA